MTGVDLFLSSGLERALTRARAPLGPTGLLRGRGYLVSNSSAKAVASCSSRSMLVAVEPLRRAACRLQLCGLELLPEFRGQMK